jgi:ribonuclease P/MRP protein subunit RPP1
MTATDATVNPYPAGDTSIARFALEASALGLGRLVSTSGQACRIGGVEIVPAVIVREPCFRDASKEVRRVSGQEKHPLVLVNAGDVSFNRSMLAFPGVDILRHLHKSQKQSFDHVSARIAAEKGVAIDLDIRPLMVTSGRPRQKILKTYREILKLHRKYGFMVTISSNAWSWLELRSPGDITAICGLFGMEEDEVAGALSSVDHILEPEQAVRVVA